LPHASDYNGSDVQFVPDALEILLPVFEFRRGMPRYDL
jgi:hypothetical protein